MDSMRARLEKALGKDIVIALSDDDNSGEPDEDILNSAGQLALEEFRFLCQKATSEIADWPPIFHEFVLVFTIERLFQRRAVDVPTSWQEKAKECRRLIFALNREEIFVNQLPARGRLLLVPENQPPIQRDQIIRKW